MKLITKLKIVFIYFLIHGSLYLFSNLNMSKNGLTLNKTFYKKDWYYSYSGSYGESHGHYIISTQDGGFLQIGETGSIPNSKILLVKINGSGALEWKRELGAEGRAGGRSLGGGHNLGNGILEMEHAYLIYGGWDGDSFIFELSKKNGEIMDEHIYETTGYAAIESMVKTDFGFVAVGYVNAEEEDSTFYTYGEGKVIFLNPEKEILLKKNLKKYISHSYKVKVYQSHLFISGLDLNAKNYVLIKMDFQGRIVFSKTYNAGKVSHNFGLDINQQGEIFLTGHALVESENWDTYTLKLDSSGEVIWQRVVGNPRGFNKRYIHDEAWGIKATKSGGAIIVGGTGDEYSEYSECIKNTCSDIWEVYLVEFSRDGETLFEKTFTESSDHDFAGEDLTLLENGDIVIAVDNRGFGFLKLLKLLF